MQIITYTEPRMLIADEGKHIREINDIYIPEHLDKEGNTIPEHFPYYADFILLADGIDVNKIDEYYVEELKEKD